MTNKPEIFLIGDSVTVKGEDLGECKVYATDYTQSPPRIKIRGDETSATLAPSSLELKHQLSVVVTMQADKRGTDQVKSARMPQPIKFSNRRSAYETAVRLSKLGMVLSIFNHTTRELEGIAVFGKLSKRRPEMQALLGYLQHIQAETDDQESFAYIQQGQLTIGYGRLDQSTQVSITMEQLEHDEFRIVSSSHMACSKGILTRNDIYTILAEMGSFLTNPRPHEPYSPSGLWTLDTVVQ